MHRRYGHNRNFVESQFSEEEKFAAYLHLLGDYTLHILPEVLGASLDAIRNGEIEPPYFEDCESGWGWDVDDSIKKRIQDQWSSSLVQALKAPRKTIRKH